jgi:hypothetical protein
MPSDYNFFRRRNIRRLAIVRLNMRLGFYLYYRIFNFGEHLQGRGKSVFKMLVIFPFSAFHLQFSVWMQHDISPQMRQEQVDVIMKTAAGMCVACTLPCYADRCVISNDHLPTFILQQPLTTGRCRRQERRASAASDNYTPACSECTGQATGPGTTPLRVVNRNCIASKCRLIDVVKHIEINADVALLTHCPCSEMKLRN